MTEPSDETTTGIGPGGGPSRTPLVVAAAVLVVVLGAIAVSFATHADRDGRDRTVTGGGSGDSTSTTTARSGDGAAAVERLWGSRWEVVGLHAAGDGETPPAAVGTGDLTIDFGADHQVSFTGCNGGSGTGVLTGATLAVPEQVSTRMACKGADGEVRMAYDAWMANVLTVGVEVRGTGDTVTLLGPSATIDLRRVT
jgi:heat shock protein HslJ